MQIPTQQSEQGSWLEHCRVHLDPHPITALDIDPLRELIVCGTNNGFLQTLTLDPEMQASPDQILPTKYSATQIIENPHPNMQPVLEIVAGHSAYYAVAGDVVKAVQPSGLSNWTLHFKHGNAPVSCCLSNSRSELLVANGKFLSNVNIHTGNVVSNYDIDTQIHKVRALKEYYVATVDGKIHVYDPNSSKITRTLSSYTGGVSELVLSGHYILSCGYVQRGPSLLTDRQVKIYDNRTMRQLPNIPFAPGARFVDVHPKLNTLIAICSDSGQLQISDINRPEIMEFHQIEAQSYVTGMKFSSSGSCLIFTFFDGSTSIWTMYNELPRLNTHSLPIDQPSIESSSDISINLLNENIPFSVIGMPYFESKLLSAWPHKFYEVGLPPPRISADVLNNVKTIDFVGYSRPPPGIKRNTNLFYNRKELKHKHMADKPRFLSEKSRNTSGSRKYDDDIFSPTDLDVAYSEDMIEYNRDVNSVPKSFRKMQIKYSRFGVEDFDFGFYNKTSFPGLETQIANSYCNPMLQALFYTTAVREIAKNHSYYICNHDVCLLCELGFLFRSLETCTVNFQATNFLIAFANLPQTKVLGLLEPDMTSISAGNTYHKIIQGFNRFILEHITNECNLLSEENRKNISIPDVFGVKLEAKTKCACKAETSRITIANTIDLVYSKKQHSASVSKLNSNPQTTPANNGSFSSTDPDAQSYDFNDEREVTFAHILQSSICRDTVGKVYCTSCSKYQMTSSLRVFLESPNVLSINAGNFSQQDSELFKDPNHPFLPARIQFVKRKDGDSFSLIVKELPKDIDPFDENDKELLDIWSKHNIIEGDEVTTYDLTAVVSEIIEEGDVRHLVSQVRVDKYLKNELDFDVDSEQLVNKWMLFNDFSVQVSSSDEARTFKSWKSPAIFLFTKVDYEFPFTAKPLPRDQILPSLVDFRLLNKVNSNNNDSLQIEYDPLSNDELSKFGKNTIVALDAEFVEMDWEETEVRSNGKRIILRPAIMHLARVSVVRGDRTSAKHGKPFIDEYIATDKPVVDYLTEFSGIVHGDLDVNTSKHPLVTLKATYRRLRNLVDLGCIFVGHGLQNDFRIINLHVPPEQVIDTVNIYFYPERHRRLSLRFLAWAVLGEDIQAITHDSIEDSLTALRLYDKYQDLINIGEFEKLLSDVYTKGSYYNFKPPSD